MLELRPGLVLEDSNGYVLLVTHVGKDGSVYAQDDPVQLSHPCVRVIREFDKSLAATTEFDFPEFHVREPSEAELQRFKKAYGEEVVMLQRMETIPAPPELLEVRDVQGVEEPTVVLPEGAGAVE